MTLRCEAEGDAPLDLSWRARDSRVDPNYDVRFVSKLIKPLPFWSPKLMPAVRTIDGTDTSISYRASKVHVNYGGSRSRQTSRVTHRALEDQK